MSANARDWRHHAEDILAACVETRRRIAGMCFESFAGDEGVREGVLRNLEVIGEAAKHLPGDVTERARDVAWGKVRGMGELRADALGVKVVWSTVTTTLDALESAVRELLA